ncbi:MAG: response regulator [Phycisphaeraceae bacterium JB051]
MDSNKHAFRVLLIEDNPDEALLTQIALTQSEVKCSIDHMASASEAWDFLSGIDHNDNSSKEVPNLVLLDLKLPGMNGIELVEHIRSREQLDSLPVIMLTNSTYAGDLKSCYAARCNAYLVKPTHIDELRTVLNNTLRFWSSIQQNIGVEIYATA